MSTAVTTDPGKVIGEWVELVGNFAKQVADWATVAGWDVAWKSLDRTEDLLGSYTVPMLIIQTAQRAVMVEPVARDVMGALGRIDLYAYPTLFRVMLLQSPESGEWRIRTDSGIFIEKPWNKETFLSLIEGLTAAG